MALVQQRRVVGRNDDRRHGVAVLDALNDLVHVASVEGDREVLRVDERLQQLAALGGLRHIPDDRGLVAHVAREVAVEHDLHQRHQEHRAHRALVAQKLGEFLNRDRPHAPPVHSVLLPASERRTTSAKTSSSDGTIGVNGGMPRPSSASSQLIQARLIADRHVQRRTVERGAADKRQAFERLEIGDVVVADDFHREAHPRVAFEGSGGTLRDDLPAVDQR